MEKERVSQRQKENIKRGRDREQDTQKESEREKTWRTFTANREKENMERETEEEGKRQRWIEAGADKVQLMLYTYIYRGVHSLVLNRNRDFQVRSNYYETNRGGEFL